MSGTVLLIEDEADIADLLRMYLEGEGFTFVHAASGEDGLDRFKQREPRLVLLDIGLPGIDGLEVCRRIRADSEVPIIMLTARDTEVDTVVGLELGADDYITKPFSPRELTARVKAVLRRNQDRPKTAQTIESHGFHIDAGRREVALPGGTVVRPTARELRPHLRSITGREPGAETDCARSARAGLRACRRPGALPHSVGCEDARDRRAWLRRLGVLARGAARGTGA